MNLHGIVRGPIRSVNPDIPVTVQVSTGSTEQPNGERIPTYAAPVTVRGQVQPMTWRDLQLVEGLNLQGTRVKIYLYGVVDGIVRSENKGGDLITIATGVYAGVYLVAQTLEQFPDWCSVAATLQNNG